MKMKQYVLVYAKTNWLVNLATREQVEDAFLCLGDPYNTLQQAVKAMQEEIENDLENNETCWVYNILEEDP